MKSISFCIMAFLLCSTPLLGLTSCSDDEEGEVEQPQVGPEDSKIPQEVLDKVHEIYSKAQIGPQKVRTVNQLAILTSICASLDGKGPITVTAATLNDEPVTLVTLGGTQEVEGQATSMTENQLASFGKPNDYLAAVTRLFENGTIPVERPVIVSGISLGGMIAQQLLGVPQIMASHHLRAIITFGSPITLPLDRSGVQVVRFADVHDRVPTLGEMILRTGALTSKMMSKQELQQTLAALDARELITATSKYEEMIPVHALSYIEDECWSKTDFLADPAKCNVLELLEKMTFYPAPKMKK